MATGQVRKSSVTEVETAESKKQKFRQVGKNTVKYGDCKICESRVEVDDKGIECEICKQWFHANCVDKKEQSIGIVMTVKQNQSKWFN